MKSVNCPECGAEVEIAEGTIAGEVIPCGECGVELEVTSTKPLTVELAPEVQEDWGE
ncbi:MAG: lysine biosynthesis protein LysW [Planctomycetota bacterium]|nr:lysine biosynthesis protein LysW [Planctomycetota bacterium]